MTSSKISQLAALMRSSELMDTQKSSKQENGPAFGALLSQTSDGGKQNAYPWNGTGVLPPKVEMANQTAFVKESSGAGLKGNGINQNSSTDIQNKLPKDTMEKLNTFEEKVTEAVAEELGVTKEEVIEAMEAMGLTVLDIMDPSKLANLVMELTGSEDIGALLLSEDFQQILGKIGELSKELIAELGLTPEELPQFMEQLQSMITDDAKEVPSDIPEQEVSQSEAETEIVESQEPKQEVETVQSSSVETIAITEQKVKNESIRENAGNTTEVEHTEGEREGQNLTVDETEQGDSTENGEEGSTEKSLTEMTENKSTAKAEDSSQHHVTYQTTAQTVNQGQAVEVTQTVVQTRIDVEDIMRQVSQMTKIMVSQTESSIEMQLNPANLGKVYLQVVSREGVITAQLAAQNEAVKEALESQVAILKENMNQQGIKVEAIEVTIASHEFERNLEQNQQNQASQQQEAEGQKASRRNINLNNPEELEGIMSEEENLVAKIMSEQGNSVDLTA